MTKWFHILKDGRTIQTGIAGVPKAIKALKSWGVKRVNRKNLKKKTSTLDSVFLVGGISFKKEVDLGNGITIVEIDPSNRRTVDPKLRKPKSSVIAHTDFNDYVKTYPNTRFIDYDNYQGFIGQIANQMKSLPQSKTSYFSVILHYKSGGTVTNNSTVYGNYNDTLDALYIKLKEYLSRYDGKMLVSSYTIRQIFRKAIGETVIFGGISPRELITELHHDIMKKDNTEMKNLFREHVLLPIKSYKNCLMSAGMIYNPKKSKCMTAEVFNQFLFTDHKFIYNENTLKDAVKNFRTKYKINTDYTCPDDLMPMMSEHLGAGITFMNHVGEKKVYNEHGYDENIIIFTYGGHAFPCVPIKDLKVDDKDLFRYQISYDRSQRPIKVPVKDKNFADEQPNYYKVSKDSKEKFEVATYDLETCNGSVVVGKTVKHQTICYASGYTAYDQGVLKTRDFWLCDGDDPIEKMLDVIYAKDNHNKQIIYAHNGGKFDTWIIFKHLSKRKDVFIQDMLIQNGRISNFTTRSCIGNKTIIFRDSISLMAASLDKLCKDFKTDTVKLTDLVNHNTIDLDYAKDPSIKDYVREYLINDCVCLHEILDQFNKVCKKYYGIDIREVITSAGIARRYYFNNHYDADSELDLCKETEGEHKLIYEIPRVEDDLIRPWYFGGRNEIFNKMGVIKGKLYYYDFTSLYPYVMSKYMFPHGKYKKITFNKHTPYDPSMFGVVKVMVKHVKRSKTPLHGLINNGKLTFPYLSDWTEMYLSSEEIKYSIEKDLGYAYKFISIYSYSQKDYLFKKVVDDCYKLKIEAQEAGNPALRSVAKIIINSLYGFWGLNKMKPQYTVRTKLSLDKKANKKEAYLTRGVLKDIKHIDQYSYYQTEELIKSPCNVNIALMITSYSRIELYDLINDIQTEGGKVYYCDTDSVITDLCIETHERLNKKFVRGGGKALGELTNETDVKCGYYNTFVSLGLKQYALYSDKDHIKNVLKFKGFNAKAKYMEKEYVDDKIILRNPDKHLGKEKLTFDDYLLMAKGGNLQVDTMTFLTSPKDIIFKEKGVIKLENCKALSMKYNKGVLHEDNTVSTIVV